MKFKRYEISNADNLPIRWLEPHDPECPDWYDAEARMLDAGFHPDEDVGFGLLIEYWSGHRPNDLVVSDGHTFAVEDSCPIPETDGEVSFPDRPDNETTLADWFGEALIGDGDCPEDRADLDEWVDEIVQAEGTGLFGADEWPPGDTECPRRLRAAADAWAEANFHRADEHDCRWCGETAATLRHEDDGSVHEVINPDIADDLLAFCPDCDDLTHEIARRGGWAHGGCFRVVLEEWRTAAFQSNEIHRADRFADEWLDAGCFEPHAATNLASRNLRPDECAANLNPDDYPIPTKMTIAYAVANGDLPDYGAEAIVEGALDKAREVASAANDEGIIQTEDAVLLFPGAPELHHAGPWGEAVVSYYAHRQRTDSTISRAAVGWAIGTAQREATEGKLDRMDV